MPYLNFINNYLIFFYVTNNLYAMNFVIYELEAFFYALSDMAFYVFFETFDNGMNVLIAKTNRRIDAYQTGPT